MLMIFILFVATIELSNCHCFEDTELVMVFLVNRHGDRTPMKSELYFSKSRDKLEPYCQKYGYGELTDVGKAHSFDLGKVFRNHYDHLLSHSYSSKNVYVDASDFTRTVMTAKIALTSAYCSETKWREDMELLPVECHVVPVGESMHIAFLNCPSYKEYLYNTFTSRPDKMNEYRHLLRDLSDTTTVDLEQYPVALYSVYDLGVSQLSLGVPLCEEQTRRWNEMEVATRTVLDILEGNDDYLALQVGGLLKECHDSGNLVIAGTDTPRFRMYSTHKFNVFSFLVAIKAIPKQSVPKYCSVAGLEFRRSKKDGTYVVTPVFIGSPEEPLQYLEIEGCGQFCEFERFKELTAKYILDKGQYDEKCKGDNRYKFNEDDNSCNEMFPSKYYNSWWQYQGNRWWHY